MPNPANPKTATPKENIRNALDALVALEARRHRQEMDRFPIKPAPTPVPTHTDDNNGSNVTTNTILCTTPRGKEWNDALENYFNNL